MKKNKKMRVSKDQLPIKVQFASTLPVHSSRIGKYLNKWGQINGVSSTLICFNKWGQININLLQFK